MRAAHGDVVVVVVMHGQDDGDGGSNGWEREKLCRMEVMVVNASVIKLCRMVGLMMAKGHVKILVGVVMGTNSCDEMVQDEGGDDGEWL